MTWRTWLAAGLAAAAGCAVAPAATQTPTPIEASAPRRASPAPKAPRGHRTMQITLQAAALTALGKPLPLEVTLSNPGSSGLVIDDPAQSLDIEFHLVDQKTREDLSFTMGKVTTTTLGSVDEYAIEVPVPKPTTIPPKGTLSFKADANMRLFLRAGDYDAYVTHKDSESNHVPLKVVYTRESVTLLFATAHDPQMSYGRREWATDRLAKLFPAFRLNLPLPDEAAASRSQREASNQPAYVRFAEWWRDQLATADLDERLEKAR
ncbi:hypothetical protein HLB44_02310 [Aquincola sp. S2]|uniref:DUF2057 domain-containing protein n=1 Tax=Pseudaquabacterium terrae TaxID=2732868 RepID=A0ABX2EAP9_9BURK|nr:hypothetical protein [Aquabacterium terrae]NRF65812.1 hypothetical protein [Aquabacterium terrae]